VRSTPSASPWKVGQSRTHPDAREGAKAIGPEQLLKMSYFISCLLKLVDNSVKGGVQTRVVVRKKSLIFFETFCSELI
jgi:hypothetical protein